MAAPDNQAEIASRIKFLIERSGASQAAFARSLGLNPSNMSKHLSGRLPVTRGLINRIAMDMSVNREWLLTGTGTPYGKAPCAAIHGVPVYDIDVTAGVAELDRLFTEDRIVGTLSMPGIDPKCMVVRVSGKSMSPEINHGSYIAIRNYPDCSEILYDKIYVIVTDSFRMVKYLRRHPSDDSKVIVHSVNPAYADAEIDKAEIRHLYTVDAVMNFDT